METVLNNTLYDDIFGGIDVMQLPGYEASAIITTDKSAAVFREDVDITPHEMEGGYKYMPWGGDNLMPYKVMELIEADETLTTCQEFNAEVCYGSGIEFSRAENLKGAAAAELEEFTEDNALPSVFLGMCHDIKHFAFAVGVIILSQDYKRIVRVARKEACYCRLSPANAQGHPDYIVYANFRLGLDPEVKEIIPLLDPSCPRADLLERIKEPGAPHKYAMLIRVPCADSTYYPIPHYASLFKGKWYNIKRLIAVAKEAKLKNSAPIKYHIEVSERYWTNLFRAEGITDRAAQKARMVAEKQAMIDFLTGAVNSGKVLFSQFYVTPEGKENHDVVITNIEANVKEGGDWTTDIQEAVNMVCFAMRVHSNLVGSVPGKSQSNNSGSDKRELYTIAHALQKPYHDLLLSMFSLVCRFNEWKGVKPTCPFVQLTTLDEHTDAKKVTPGAPKNDNNNSQS